MVKIYSFGEWQLDARLSELRCAGKPLELEPKVFDVLLYLIEHRDRVVVERGAHRSTYGPDRFVGKATLVRSVVAARRAIGDNGRDQRCIKTLRNRGYRFVAPVEERVDTLPEEEARVALMPSLPSEGYPWDRAEAAPAPTPPPRTRGRATPRWASPSTAHDSLKRDYIACPQCQQENSVKASFCGECGARLVWVCPACGHAESLHTRFCSACGTLLRRSLPATSALSIDATEQPSASTGRVG